MKRSRKFIMTAAALTLTLGAVALTGVGIASAKKAAATGTVSCTAAAGSVTFDPPLVSTGPYVSEKTTAKVNFTSCTGSTKSPTKGAINAVLSSITTDQCPPPSVAGSSGGSLTIKWAPGSIEPSVVAFSSHGSGSGGPDNGDGFIYPASGGTGSVTGSYPGSDGGKTSTAAVYSNLSSTALLQECASKTGLKKMTVVGGSINLK